MAGSGGAWKVAYADFVTAMMAFFLVMWIVAQNKPAVKAAIAGYFNDPYGKSATPGRSNSLLPNKDGGALPKPLGPPKPTTGRGQGEAPAKVDDSAEDGARSAKPSVAVMHESDRSTVGTVIPFADDSAALDQRGMHALDTLAPELLGKFSKIEIRGHASGRPLPADGPFKDPWALCYARSAAVMQYLAEKGVQTNRFRLSQGGGFEPLAQSPESGGRGQQSRVEIFVLNELISSSTPGNDEKKPPRFKKPGLKRPSIPKAAPPVETG